MYLYLSITFCVSFERKRLGISLHEFFIQFIIHSFNQPPRLADRADFSANDRPVATQWAIAWLEAALEYVADRVQQQRIHALRALRRAEEETSIAAAAAVVAAVGKHHDTERRRHRKMLRGKGAP